jgi:hypothetical protein
MKKYLLASLLFCSACQQDATTSVEKPSLLQEDAKVTTPLQQAKQLGECYVGNFSKVDYENYNPNETGSNLLNMIIDTMANGNIAGHTIVAGNDRPFKGKFENINNTIKAIVAEPGDNKEDGTFTFSISVNKDTINGTWQSFDTTIPVTQREFTLVKTTFQYQPDSTLQSFWDNETKLQMTEYEDSDGDITAEAITIKAKAYNASTTVLKNTDVENLKRGDLEVIRNLIYARHGYSFRNRRMRFFMERNLLWYIPVSTDVRNQLTAVEKQNIALLKRYEQHAEKYYDYFGR